MYTRRSIIMRRAEIYLQHILWQVYTQNTLKDGGYTTTYHGKMASFGHTTIWVVSTVSVVSTRITIQIRDRGRNGARQRGNETRETATRKTVEKAPRRLRAPSRNIGHDASANVVTRQHFPQFWGDKKNDRLSLTSARAKIKKCNDDVRTAISDRNQIRTVRVVRAIINYTIFVVWQMKKLIQFVR